MIPAIREAQNRRGNQHRPVAQKEDEDYVPSQQGGCWFCKREYGLMRFTTEWDAWYHPQCAEKSDSREVEFL